MTKEEILEIRERHTLNVNDTYAVNDSHFVEVNDLVHQLLDEIEILQRENRKLQSSGVVVREGKTRDYHWDF